MSKVVVYIATSLDGFVAGVGDDLSWLEPFDSEGDHGFAEFIEGVGAAIMGARTYQQALQKAEYRIKGVKNYVLSRAPMDVPEQMEAEFFDDGPAAAVQKARRETDKDIYVVGGGKVVSSFLNAELVDELRHFVAPVLLGEGLPLYTGIARELRFTTVETKLYPSGIVGLRYTPQR